MGTQFTYGEKMAKVEEVITKVCFSKLYWFFI
jgi:hypothetical protein